MWFAGHFGSGVASYFIFLRWLFGINIVLTIMTGAFIVLPELLAGAPFGTTRSKTIPKEHLASAQDLDTIWSLGARLSRIFIGYLQYSVLFYGYYGRVRKIGSAGYRLPLAYFLVGMAVFAYSFIILLRKMAKNSRLSLASASDENYTFCWRVFCAWDYLIGNPEAAESKGAAIVNNIREAIVEEQEKKKDTSLAVLVSLRILANILVLLSLAGSIYIIYFVVDRSQKLEQEKPELTLWEKNEEENLATIVPEISDRQNSTAGVALEPNRTKSATPITLNHTALYEYNMRSQQDQCWETYEMLKLSIIDMIFTVASILLIDFIRGLFVRYLSDCWCWDLESKFVSDHTFIHSSTPLTAIDWDGQEMGAFFSPCLPAFNVLKLIGLMYLRSWAVLTCNVPHQQVFRASSMLIYYLQAIARSLKFTNNQLRMQLQSKQQADRRACKNLRGPEEGNKKPEQESDITSQESSVRSSSPRRNGSVANFESPARRGNSIRTITQSASRSDVTRSIAASPNPSIPVLQKHRMDKIPSRHPGFLGGATSCRSKSYHHVAYNPCGRYTENIHSDPLFRKSVRLAHPDTVGLATGHSFSGRRNHTTRYVIVNEHEVRKKLLRSATRIPRHYREPPSDIVELYPRSVKRFATRVPHRSHQPHLSEEEEEEEEEEEVRSSRRGSFGQSHRPRSLSDLHQPPGPARFYIGDQAGSELSMAQVLGGEQFGAQGEEEMVVGDWEGDMASRSRSISQTNAQSGSALPGAHSELQVKPKTKHKVAPSLTESDSASVASSSDPQNSSTDQYIQVIHNKDKYLKSSAKLTKKKSKASIDINVSGSNDLVCSNV
ncbi:hypothetical protein JZ751_019445 [Albula glossodonta]|uniref:Transmembrane channel-like protein n=1 Tax=Albula glossodonta TaxID=121402 RepID=A0A8T2NQH6_9TELE|nr:hypothetical protein JZ751_019445 [Albula glossodonta]